MTTQVIVSNDCIAIERKNGDTILDYMSTIDYSLNHLRHVLLSWTAQGARALAPRDER